MESSFFFLPPLIFVFDCKIPWVDSVNKISSKQVEFYQVISPILFYISPSIRQGDF